MKEQNKPKSDRQGNANNQKGKLSFYPLSFDEAVSDVLKVKPEPKPTKKKWPSRGKSVAAS